MDWATDYERKYPHVQGTYPLEQRLPDETVIESQDFLFEILELFDTHYGRQIQRFFDDYSADNIVHSSPSANLTDDDPPF